MASLVGSERMLRKRLEKFHQKCIHGCGNREQFRKRFDVNVGHIADGILKNPRRASISNEDMAAIIRQGSLNYETCAEGPRITIAVDGIFRNFEWNDYGSGAGKVARVVDSRVHVRVVVRETGRPKELILTVYIMDFDPTKYPNLPEVDREIW